MQNELLSDPLPEIPQQLSSIAPEELAADSALAARESQAVHEWLVRTQFKARHDKTMFWGGFIFLQALVCVPICMSAVVPLMRNGHFTYLALAMMFAPAIGISALALRFAFKKPDWNAEELARIGGVQAVGPLIELLSAPKLPKELKPLYQALTDLLPQMKVSDAGLLCSDQRKVLYPLLRNDSGVYAAFPDLFLAFRLAILKALEQVGDADAIPIVQSLATRKARTPGEIAVQAAALECLPLLQINSGHVEATKLLLRASSTEAAAPSTLLRSGQSSPVVDSDQLLHASHSPPHLP